MADGLMLVLEAYRDALIHTQRQVDVLAVEVKALRAESAMLHARLVCLGEVETEARTLQ